LALGAAAIASGCGGKDSSNGNGSIADGSIGDAGCPADLPAQGAPCELQSTATCSYPDGMCNGFPQNQTAACEQGTWILNGPGSCNPPPPIYEAGPDVYDAGPDGEGQDGSHISDATGDVAPDAESD
jgi:hypothetical protein